MNIFIFYKFLIFHFFEIAFEKEFVILVKLISRNENKEIK